MKSKAIRAICLAGLLCGVMDISAAFLVYGMKGISPPRLLQSIASGLLGSYSYEGGMITAAFGGILHFVIAFGAATCFYLVSRKMHVLTKYPVAAGILYGVIVYFFMNLIVLPLSAYPHPIIRRTDIILRGLAIHMICVGLPISLAVHRYSKQGGHVMRARFIAMITICFLMAATKGFAAEDQKAKATFAGGCYWCMEEAFEKVDGVRSVTSGFMNGIEAIEVQYDSRKIDYGKLLDVFWKNIDPTDAGGQFCDRGTQYVAAIFYQDDQERLAAEQSKQGAQQRLGKQIVTGIVPATKFSAVDEEQQDYYRKNPLSYKRYKTGCGREQRLQSIWR
jgi:peptide-methionine (S)-S-oxide reductase